MNIVKNHMKYKVAWVESMPVFSKILYREGILKSKVATFPYQISKNEMHLLSSANEVNISI